MPNIVIRESEKPLRCSDRIEAALRQSLLRQLRSSILPRAASLTEIADRARTSSKNNSVCRTTDVKASRDFCPARNRGDRRLRTRTRSFRVSHPTEPSGRRQSQGAHICPSFEMRFSGPEITNHHLAHRPGAATLQIASVPGSVIAMAHTVPPTPSGNLFSFVPGFRNGSR